MEALAEAGMVNPGTALRRLGPFSESDLPPGTSAQGVESLMGAGDGGASQHPHPPGQQIGDGDGGVSPILPHETLPVTVANREWGRGARERPRFQQIGDGTLVGASTLPPQRVGGMALHHGAPT